MTIAQLLDCQIAGLISPHELITGLRQRLQEESERRTDLMFTAAYATHRSHVRRVLSATGCPASMLDDMCSEVWMRLWARRHSFNPNRGSLEAFMATIARSAAYDWWRKEKAETVPIPAYTGDEPHAIESISSPSTADEINLRLDLQRILNSDERRLLGLMEERFSGKEIAERLGISEKATESRIIRLRQKVRNYCNGGAGNDQKHTYIRLMSSK